MNEIIPINNATIGEEVKQTVNARELHGFLEVGKDFSSWIKVQIYRARLVENRDFIVFTQKGENPNGGRPSSEYHLTIESGKHVAMMSGTDKGFEVRDYFIECERRSKQAAADPTALLNDPAAMRGLLLNDPAAMRGLLLTYTEKVIDLEIKVSERDKLISHIQPQAEALQRISLANGSLCVTDTAKTLQVQPKKLFAILQQNKWIYKRAGCEHWVGYQDKLQQQLLEHKTTTVTRTDGSEKITEQVRVTPKGLSKLSLMLNGDAAAA